MSLKSQVLQSGRPKRLYLWPGASTSDIDLVPRLYLEAKIDFADVRSGLRETFSVNRAFEICRFEEDTIWTDDMVWPVDPDQLSAVAPPAVSVRELPDIVNSEFLSSLDSRFLAYLMRSFHAKLLRNSYLNIYSRAGESLEDFHGRCIEILKEPCRRELDALQEVFNRSLEQIRQRYLTNEAWGAYDRSRAAAQNRSEFRIAADDITSVFINTGLTLVPKPFPRESVPASQGGADLAERLAATEAEARQAIEKILNSYREKALSTDEYIIHPNYRDIHLVRTSILWMPEVLR